MSLSVGEDFTCYQRTRASCHWVSSKNSCSCIAEEIWRACVKPAWELPSDIMDRTTCMMKTIHYDPSFSCTFFNSLSNLTRYWKLKLGFMNLCQTRSMSQNPITEPTLIDIFLVDQKMEIGVMIYESSVITQNLDYFITDIIYLSNVDWKQSEC